jgi:chemotaxis signal transduction protein
MKIAAYEHSQDPARARKPRVAEPAILFAVSRQLFAISADSVQEIRSTDSISGSASDFDSPLVPKVRHTFERNQRLYYVVNACTHFGLRVSRPALVLILRQLRVAVLVDRIERMTELNSVSDLPLGFTGEERRWYRGLAYLDDHVIPVVDPRGFLAPEEFRMLDETTASSFAASVEGAASR